MKKLFAGITLILFAMSVFAIILGLPIMLLWNWVVPDIFSLREITFLEAIGLNLLCGFLFKTTVST